MSAHNLTLLTDLYELTMMQGYFETQENETVVFDVFFREIKQKRLLHHGRPGAGHRIYQKSEFFL